MQRLALEASNEEPLSLSESLSECLEDNKPFSIEETWKEIVRATQKARIRFSL